MKKNLASFGTALSRDEAKKVIGGKLPSDGGGITPCASPTVVCHEVDNVKYYCSWDYGENCCCGHDDGHRICQI